MCGCLTTPRHAAASTLRGRSSARRATRRRPTLILTLTLTLALTLTLTLTLTLAPLTRSLTLTLTLALTLAPTLPLTRRRASASSPASTRRSREGMASRPLCSAGTRRTSACWSTTW